MAPITSFSPRTRPIEPERLRGRGSASNRTGRFESLSRIDIDDGWAQGRDAAPDQGAPPIRTEIRHESIAQVITRNTSPDLPFDQSVNPYRGCEHGCSYCFARPSHAYLGLSPGLDFETRLIARPGAPQALEAALRKSSYVPKVIAIGTNTDPYQPCEATLRITRGCLDVLARFQHPVAVVTKGTLIERDMDLLAPMAAQGLVRVGLSVTSLDPQLARAMEPRVPTPDRKMRCIEQLSAAGIPVRVMVSPVVPGLTDPELEGILQRAKPQAPAAPVGSCCDYRAKWHRFFEEWLTRSYPGKAAKVLARVREMHGGALYSSQWHQRMRGEGVYAQMIARRFKIALRRLDLSERAPPLRCDLFRRPLATAQQGSLFE